MFLKYLVLLEPKAVCSTVRVTSTECVIEVIFNLVIGCKHDTIFESVKMHGLCDIVTKSDHLFCALIICSWLLLARLNTAKCLIKVFTFFTHSC